MSLIAAAAYNTNNLYNTANEQLTNVSQTSKGESSKEETVLSIPKGDRVTLSKEALIAQTREALGLTSSGRLKREDLEAAAEKQKESVTSTLTEFMKELGLEENQKITLALDGESKIVIQEKFSGKTELEQKLNEDPSFSLAFRSLSANNEILGYAGSQGKNMPNLFEVMNSGDSWDEIASLASQYSDMKSSNNPLATLISLGRSQDPYTFTHDPVGTTSTL